MHEHHTHLSDDILAAGLDGELNGEVQVAYEEGMASCPTCARRAKALAQASAETAALLRAASHDARAGRHDRARARLSVALREASTGVERTWAARWRVTRLAPRWALAAAALFLITIGGAVMFREPVDGPGEDEAVRAALPLSSLTPGAWSSVRPDELCATDTSTPPPIPASVRDHVLASYGMQEVPADQYELDYLVTPELGGVPDPRNLWPQPYVAEPWNALVKDELERLLSSMVCSGRLNLRVAQQDMSQDWVAAYRKYFRTRDPLRTHVGKRPDFVTARGGR